MAKIYRNKAGEKLYPVCKWEDNQHKIYNAYDRIVIRLYEAHENGGEDLEALYKEQERIDACVIDGLVYATYPMRRKTPCFSYGDIRRVHRIYASN